MKSNAIEMKNHDFQIGELYNRRLDIHDKFGGSRQGGISSCKSFPYIFLFTGESGEQYGYGYDGWDESGIFNYTGEGQNGDMQFIKGNKAIRDHAQNGKDILLFQSRGKSKPYRFLGEFVCVGYDTASIPDVTNKDRQGIIFQLKNVDEAIEDNFIPIIRSEKWGLSALREKAYSAVSDVKKVKSSESKRNYYERNASIKEYVLARAVGICECCGKQAPFLKKDGSPYLEPHHIYKISDKGIDHPRMMAAVTPNCHREIHCGKNGEAIDRRLEKIIADKERKVRND